MYRIRVLNHKTNQVHDIASSDQDVSWQMINVHGLKRGEWTVQSVEAMK